MITGLQVATFAKHQGGWPRRLPADASVIQQRNVKASVRVDAYAAGGGVMRSIRWKRDGRGLAVGVHKQSSKEK